MTPTSYFNQYTELSQLHYCFKYFCSSNLALTAKSHLFFSNPFRSFAFSSHGQKRDQMDTISTHCNSTYFPAQRNAFHRTSALTRHVLDTPQNTEALTYYNRSIMTYWKMKYNTEIWVRFHNWISLLRSEISLSVCR